MDERDVLRLAQLGWVHSDLRADRLTCSREACALLGLSPEESLGSLDDRILRSVHPEDVERVRGARHAFVAGGTSGELDFRVISAAGDVRFVHARVEVERDAEGIATHVFGTIQDVTERRLLQERLADSEELFRAVVDHATDALFLHGEQGAIVDVNRHACAMLGYTREELLGMMPASFDSALTAEEVAGLTARLAAGEVVTFESRHRRKDGSTIPVEVRIRRFTVGERHLSIALARDIAERKEAERKLKASEERFRELAEKIEDVFWVADPTYENVLYVSPAYETVWGRSCQSLYDHPRSWLDAIVEEDRERVVQALPRQLTGDFDEEYRIVRRDGSVRWIHDSGFAVRDAEGQVLRVVGSARDVTERRLLQEQLFHAQKMDAVGQLAGGIAHDFNNVVTAILGEADLALGDQDLPAATREAFDNVRTAAASAARLTKQLLLFSRREVLRPRQLELNAAVAQFARLVERIIGETVQLRLDLHEAPLVVTADPGMVDQLLMNLVVNARDAMPSGGKLSVQTTIRDVASARGRERPGRFACIRVRDTGVGIAAEVLPRIFEPFFTTKERGRGVGLGLATSFGIAEQHHGWISVDSHVGVGTTFEVCIPLTETTAERSATAAHAATGAGTVLVVEDNAQVRALARRVLRAGGFTVLEAEDGAAGLRVWAEHHHEIDVVLTDLVMPGIGGQELAKKLRVEEPTLPIVFMSGYSATIAGTELQLGRGERFVAKPFTRTELIDAIREAMEG